MPNVAYIGIAQIQFSGRSGDVLVAPNLGSCLGITAYDPLLRRAGLIHCLLPSSTLDPMKALEHPSMYVDTGVQLLIEGLVKRGSNRNTLIFTAAGGAQIGDPQGVFQIGRKNFESLQAVFAQHALRLHRHEVGGSSSRTVSLYVDTGEVWLQCDGIRREFFVP
jgi:chemotaxis protein CheD